MAENKGNKRLLAIHQGALGDVVTSFPALLLLKESGFRVHLACRQSTGIMARSLGMAERNLDSESAFFSSIYSDSPETDAKLSRFLSAYDLMVIFSFSDTVLFNLKKLSGKPVFRVLPRPEPSERSRVQDYLVAGLKNAGLLKEGFDQIRPDLFPDYRTPGFDRRKIFLHPGSGSPLKNWPLKNFVELERKLVKDGFRPVLIVGPAEEGFEAKIGKIRASVWKGESFPEDDYPRETPPQNRIREFRPKTESRLEEVLKISDLNVLVDILKSGGGYIGNDSGATHLSAWLGNPTLAIFGPTDPCRWKPAGRRVETVATKPDCAPCFETEKVCCKNPKCLSRISPTQVKEAFLKMIAEID